MLDIRSSARTLCLPFFLFVNVSNISVHFQLAIFKAHLDSNAQLYYILLHRNQYLSETGYQVNKSRSCHFHNLNRDMFKPNSVAGVNKVDAISLWRGFRLRAATFVCLSPFRTVMDVFPEPTLSRKTSVDTSVSGTGMPSPKSQLHYQSAPLAWRIGKQWRYLILALRKILSGRNRASCKHFRKR